MSVADEEAMKITRAAFWPGKKQAACTCILEAPILYV